MKLYNDQPWSVRWNILVSSPALPRVATNANASGRPPKLASTPEAVSTASRSIRNREVRTACAIGTPTAVPISAVSADSFTLETSAVQ